MFPSACQYRSGRYTLYTSLYILYAIVTNGGMYGYTTIVSSSFESQVQPSLFALPDPERSFTIVCKFELWCYRSSELHPVAMAASVENWNATGAHAHVLCPVWSSAANAVVRPLKQRKTTDGYRKRRGLNKFTVPFVLGSAGLDLGLLNSTILGFYRNGFVADYLLLTKGPIDIVRLLDSIEVSKMNFCF